jgi:hypothetical protein
MVTVTGADVPMERWIDREAVPHVAVTVTEPGEGSSPAVSVTQARPFAVVAWACVSPLGKVPQEVVKVTTAPSPTIVPAVSVNRAVSVVVLVPSADRKFGKADKVISRGRKET